MKELPEFITGKTLTTLLGHIHAMIAVVKKDGALVSWNPALEKSKPAFNPSNKLQDFVTDLDRDEIEKRLNSKDEQHWLMDIVTSVEDQPVQCDCMLIPLDKEQSLFIAERIEADSTLSDIVQRLTNQVRLFQVERDTANKLAQRKHTEVEAVLAQAHEVSQIDALTFLPNRRMIIRELQDELLRAQRYHTQFSISFVDVDHFKKINDTYGHLTGDDVLKQMGSMIKDHIRHPDIAGRYGGEEFLVLLPNSDAKAAIEQASRLCKYVREAVIQSQGHKLQITVSVGIAEFQYGIDTWESLLKRADTALYEAKNSGRDRWVVAD